MRIIGALAKQLDAEIQIQARHPGTEIPDPHALKPDAE